MEVVEKARRVADLIEELANLYDRPGYEGIDLGDLPGYLRSFSEQMDLIALALRVIAGEAEDYEIDNFYEMEDRESLSFPYIEDYIIKKIDWLRPINEQCEKILEIQYQSGGSIFKQLQQKNMEWDYNLFYIIINVKCFF